MRGKQKAQLSAEYIPRITPAGAGKTICCCFKISNIQDHPRRYGENTSNTIPFPTTLGSPPQVRGKRSGNHLEKHFFGITPAGAGKTTHTENARSNGQDHPRRCGENDLVASGKRHAMGSPPQVRGKLCKSRILQCVGGITPAGAGKTECWSWL